MATFMGDDVHISACSVEVCKNKRRLEIWNIGHIAALTLCFSSEHVKKFVLHHKIKKFLCLRRQFTVHFLSCRKNFLRRSDRRRISIREIDVCINIGKLLHTNTLSALLVEFIGKWDKVFLHLFPEIFDHFLVITVAVHTVITKLHIILIAKLSCLLGSVFHHLIVNLVDFICNRQEIVTDCLPCFSSQLTVRAGLELSHERQIVNFSLKRNLRCSDQLTVTAAQCIFFLH